MMIPGKVFDQYLSPCQIQAKYMKKELHFFIINKLQNQSIYSLQNCSLSRFMVSTVSTGNMKRKSLLLCCFREIGLCSHILLLTLPQSNQRGNTDVC